MIEKFKGIILKVADYKDADKLATIFSHEYGVLTAKFAGVKKDRAKYKAVAQPFVFANFVVTEKGSALTITQADIIDDFPLLLQNYSKTICAYVVLDIVRSILPAQKQEEDLFLLTLNCLKNIETQNEHLALIAYILNFLKFSGVELTFADNDAPFLNTLTGNFTSHEQESAQQIDKKVYATLKMLSSNSAAMPDCSLATQKQAVHLLHNIIYLKFGADIKSFEFI